MIFRAKISLSNLARRLSRSARILLLLSYLITQSGIAVFIPAKTFANEEISKPKSGGEVVSLRTESSKTISLGKNPEGLDLYQLISFADKVHFHTPSGWQEVDNNIIPERFEKFSYRNSANDFTFRAGELLENGVLYSGKNEICEFKLDSIQAVSLNNSRAEIIENKVIYPEIYPNADLEFTVNSTGIATEIVVKKEDALKEKISFELVNCRPSSFNQAQMSDDDSGAAVDEEIITDGSKTILVLAPDYSRLGEIKGEVRIDPSISASSNSDTFVSPSNPIYGNGGRRFMAIGTYYDSTIGATFQTGRALIHFGILNIPQNAIPADAKLQIHHYGTNGGNGNSHISRITSPWDENTVWSGPSFEGDYGGCSFPYYNNNFTAELREIPVSNLNLIENLRSPNYGVMLKNYDDNTPGSVICSRNIPSGPCHSGMEPKIVVNYALNQAPNPPTLDYPNEGWELGSDEDYKTVECDTTGAGKGCSVTFHIKTEDPDNTFPLETEVEVKRSEGGYANFTYYQTSGGWFSNQIHLSDGRWSWKARTKDKFNSWSNWSVTKNFIVDTSAPTRPNMIKEPDFTRGFTNEVNSTTSTDSLIGGVKYNFEVSEYSNFFKIKENSGWTSRAYYKFYNLQNDKKYYYRVRAKDALGNTTDWGSPASSIQDSQQPSVKNINLTNKIISPQNQDGHLDSSAFSFSVDEKYWKSTFVQIINNRGKTVREYSNLGKSVNITINGKDNGGTWLPDGIYVLQIIAHDLSGNITSIKGKPGVNDNLRLIIDNTPSILNINYPVNGSWFNSANTDISGITNTDSKIYIINLNANERIDPDIDLNTGIFDDTIGLISGLNKIYINSKDPYKNQTEKYLSIYKETAEPETNLISPLSLTNNPQPDISFNLTDFGFNDGTKTYISGIDPDKSYLSLIDIDGNEIILVNEGVNISPDLGHFEHNCEGSGEFGLSGKKNCVYNYIFTNTLQPDGIYKINSTFFDIAGNSKTCESNFELDTHTFLEVNNPNNGALFNHSLITINGRAEKSSTLEITGNVSYERFKIDPVQNNEDLTVSNCIPTLDPQTDGIKEVCNWEFKDFVLEKNINEDAEVLNNINYKLTDLAGNIEEINHSYKVNLYAVNLSINSNLAYFSPNGDGRQDGIDFINLHTDGIVQTYEIRINNTSRNILKILHGENSLPPNIYWNGKFNPNNPYSDGNQYIPDGDYSYSLYLKTTDNIEFETVPVKIFARTKLDNAIVITSPKNDSATTKGVVNVQGQSPANTRVKVCVDVINLPESCNFEYLADSNETGSFSLIIPMHRLENQTQTENIISAKAYDEYGNETPNSNFVKIIVDTIDPFISVTAVPALSAVNKKEAYESLLKKLDNNEPVSQEDLLKLKTVILRATVTQNTERVRLSFADFSNLNELPEEYNYQNIGFVDGAENGCFANLFKEYFDGFSPINRCENAECSWDFYYPVPPVIGGVYEIEFEGKKGETVEKMYAGIMIDGTIPTAPIILDINKIVNNQTQNTNLFQNKFYSNSPKIKIIGAAEAGLTIEVFDQNKNALCTTKTNPVGIFTCQTDISNLYSNYTDLELSLASAAKDFAGNVSVSVEKTTLVIDKIPPEFKKLAAANQWIQSGELADLKVESNENLSSIHLSTPQFSLENFSLSRDYSSGSGSFIIPGKTPEGKYSVKTTITDIAGNQNKETYTLYIDNTPPQKPTITTTDWGKYSGIDYKQGIPAKGRLVPNFVTSGSNLKITGFAEENTGLDFYIDAKKVKTVEIEHRNSKCQKTANDKIADGITTKSGYHCPYSINIKLEKEKGHVITAKTRDKANNESIAGNNEILYLDKTKPDKPTIINKIPETTFQNQITITTESEKMTDIEYRLINPQGKEVNYKRKQNNSTGILTQTIELNEDGEYKIQIQTTDAAGNKSEILESRINKVPKPIENPEVVNTPDVVLGTSSPAKLDAETGGLGAGGPERIDGADTTKPWADKLGEHLDSVRMTITIRPDESYTIDRYSIDAPQLTMIETTPSNLVKVYGIAIPKKHKIYAHITKTYKTYNEARDKCNAGLIINENEKECMKKEMGIEDLGKWQREQATKCLLYGPAYTVCVLKAQYHDRNTTQREFLEYETEHAMVSFHKDEEGNPYIGSLWNDTNKGNFVKDFTVNNEVRTGDRLKAQTTIFGGFEYEGVRIDYGKDGGLRSGFGNVLAVGEEKSVLHPIGFPLRNFKFVSGGNYYSKDYLTHYFGEDGKSRICEKIKCDGDKQSPGDFRISRGANETGHQKNEIDFEPFKYNYAMPSLVVSTVDGIMEIDETRIDERPFKDRFGNWRCKNYNEIGAHVRTIKGDLVNYLHLDPKSNNLKLWQSAKQNGNHIKVKHGDIIGYLGNTGCSTGPHLHYDIKDYDAVTFYSTFYNTSGLNILPENINITTEIQDYLELFFNLNGKKVDINYNL